MPRTRVKLHSFGDNFKKLRKKKNLTQSKFVTQFEEFNKDQAVTIDTVKNWEQHYNIPEIGTLLTLCDFFGCDLDYLFGRLPETTHDKHYICETTGLSEKSIDSLIGSKNSGLNYSNIINPILENIDKYSIDILLSMEGLKEAKKKDKETINIQGVKFIKGSHSYQSGLITLEPAMAIKFYASDIGKYFEQIFIDEQIEET